jgi:hypothetical protein
VDGVAKADISLGGAAALAGGYVEIQQVNVNDVAIDGVTNLTITQVIPVVYASGITSSPAGYSVQKLGSTTDVTFSVDDSLGDPASGQIVSAFRQTSGTPDAANLLDFATTGSEGYATVTVSGASGLVAGDAETYNFTVSGYSAASFVSDSQLEITYTTDGGVTTMSAQAVNNGSALGDDCSTDAAVGCTLDDIAQIEVPYGGLIDDSTTALWNLTSDDSTGGNNPGNYVVIKITTDPGNAAVVTVPEGAKVSNEMPDATTAWSDGSTSATISSDGASSGVGYAYIWATKVGTHDVTITSGGKTVTQKIHAVTNSVAAYNIELTPASQTVAAGSIGSATLTVTDVFGNPVTTSATNGYVTVTASGEVLLAGFQPTADYTTGTDGTKTVTVIAGNAGAGTLSATPAVTNNAWSTTYDYAALGFPAPVTSAAATVTVTSSSTKSITITGERGTVKGKPGIMVDGLTTGFAEGDLMVPYIKFPGQTSYSAGSARPAVDADGEFYWQRKTGKKIYVYFKNEDGSVKSDRIIIQAK